MFNPGYGPSIFLSLNYAFEYGELSNSQKQAIITLIEKKREGYKIDEELAPDIS